VLIQAGQSLASLDVLLNGPSAAGDGHQGGESDRLGCVAGVERQLLGARVAADQQVTPSRPGWLTVTQAQS
jgi:hypothetical protein